MAAAFYCETPIPKVNKPGVCCAQRSGGYNTPQLAVEYVSKARFVVHTRD